jgi:hypothetical protein
LLDTDIKKCRPSQRPQPPQLPRFPVSKSKPESSQATSAIHKHAVPESRDSVWTLSSQPIPFDYPELTAVESFEMHTRQKRSFSQSTADTQLANERLESGAVKIVIDRPDSAPRSEQHDQVGFSGIEVPIPHYRMGTPSFSARGTPFFHQSSYTKSSANGEESSVFSGAEFENVFPKPPGIEAHHVISRRHSYASPQSRLFQAFSSTHGSTTGTPQAYPSPQVYTLYRPKGPIEPQIFDIIAKAPNDPAIVKYSPINRDIIAATPARIITQITSEKFLDYELLSDFFLTVRSYLSTHDLLSYLLARFEWALNRYDDNGRVVRVRAFAALRHWILNYFSYDFVTDRELRVQFCERLNALTRLLRASGTNGASDMKLISDLKKCWNGRCLVYWDNPALAADGQQELDIQPGGILGSRDSRLVSQSQLRPVGTLPASLSVNPATVAAGAQTISNWYSAVMEHGERQAQGHMRQTSNGTSRSLPISPTSEQSQPALSCSIPAKGLKKTLPYANKALGIHPIPTDPDGRRVCPAAPSSLSNEPARPSGVHRRSGSFSDAARDHRAPLSSDVPTSSEAIAQDLYHGNSMLRGFAFPPVTPYVIAAPTTPAVEIPSIIPQPSTPSRETEALGNRKKKFIGNIRRALSSKHGPMHGPNAQPSSSMPAVGIGKSATLPMHVTYQITNGKHTQAIQSQSRIDLLAADVFEAFQRATTAPVQESPADININIESEHSLHQSVDQAVSMSDGSNRLLLPEAHRPEISRLASGVTDSSRSILIADDTGLNLPAHLGSLHFEHPLQNLEFNQEEQVQSAPNLPGQNVNHMENEASLRVDQMPARPHSSIDESRVRSFGMEDEERDKWIPSMDLIHSNRPAIHNRNTSFGTTRSASLSLRRHASFHSTFAKHNKGLSIDTSAGSQAESIAAAKEAPTRIIRRRPGGDLKATQNVHDLEGIPRPRSAGSVTTYAESVRDSQMLGFGEKIARTFTLRKSPRDLDQAAHEIQQSQNEVKQKKISYVRTHSSQHARGRPSFEAAVAEFARIPDDEEGGIEATLLKLEGKYKSPLHSPVPRGLSDEGSSKISPTRSQDTVQPASPGDLNAAQPVSNDDFSGNNIGQASDSSIPLVPLGHNPWQPTPLQPVQLKSNEPRETVISTLYAGSEDSYNSVPLLERGAEEKMSPMDKGKGRAEWPDQGADGVGSDLNSKRLKHGSLAPSATTDSFLLDENDEFLSDVSSELSLDTIDGDGKSEEWRPAEDDQEKPDYIFPYQPQHPPSPPMTVENALSLESQAKNAQQERKPPTPDPSPIAQHIEPNIPAMNFSKLETPRKSLHMPYILGYDSEVLAQQFTILEKEALREIDWRDLVDLRWQNSPASPLNWVNYLLTQDPLGIDLVTARFNIMVKWAISEIVLTDAIEERALVIMKYIHVAQQARRIHNYATLFQLTIALTSADCTRLSKTWDLVPTAEKDILQDLEILVSPRRNFYNLRTEMEKVNADEGCIPVLGKRCFGFLNFFFFFFFHSMFAFILCSFTDVINR